MKYNMKHLWFEKGAYANKKSRVFLATELKPEKIKKIAAIRNPALDVQAITRPFLVELIKIFPMRKFHSVLYLTIIMVCPVIAQTVYA